MKKIIFFTLEDTWMGGVASVNEALRPALENEGFCVKNLFLRGCETPLPPCQANTVLRKGCPWRFVHGAWIKEALREKKPGKALFLAAKRIGDTLRNRWDFLRAKLFFLREKPDCIVVTSYLLLDAVPRKYRSRTLHHVHTSLTATLEQRENKKTLERYNGTIGFLWLSRGICEEARALGFAPSFYCYNPLTRYPEQRTEAETMTTLSVITRFSPEKRLPLAVKLIRKALDSLPDPNSFRVEFWGSGPEEKALTDAIGTDARFGVMGRTSDPFGVLSRTRLTVNTSSFEGFSISILEGAAAGVPTVSFVFGEAAEEEIENGKTGFLVPMDDENAFVERLVSLLSDDDLCRSLSLAAREKAARFEKSRIAKDWCDLLLSLPLDKTKKP